MPDLLDAIVQLKAAGVSILLVEQNAKAAFAVADGPACLRNGVIRLRGPAAERAADHVWPTATSARDIGDADLPAPRAA